MEYVNLEYLVNLEYVVNLEYSVNLEYFELGDLVNLEYGCHD